ncbi:MAG: hypothetical protein ACI9OJ_000751 [Myxococcota bacterium]|jgi:hypothetical protein
MSGLLDWVKRLPGCKPSRHAHDVRKSLLKEPGGRAHTRMPVVAVDHQRSSAIGALHELGGVLIGQMRRAGDVAHLERMRVTNIHEVGRGRVEVGSSTLQSNFRHFSVVQSALHSRGQCGQYALWRSPLNRCPYFLADPDTKNVAAMPTICDCTRQVERTGVSL